MASIRDDISARVSTSTNFPFATRILASDYLHKRSLITCNQDILLIKDPEAVKIQVISVRAAFHSLLHLIEYLSSLPVLYPLLSAAQNHDHPPRATGPCLCLH